jgi:hypothetical protein
MAAVQTCTLPAPSTMNSAASRHVEIPPMPEIGFVPAKGPANAWYSIHIVRLFLMKIPSYSCFCMKSYKNG